jgi:hypothetical protein
VTDEVNTQPAATSPVVDAFLRLRAIAQTGRQFTFGEYGPLSMVVPYGRAIPTYKPTPDSEPVPTPGMHHAFMPVGHGHDFTRKLRLPTMVGQDAVEATASFRVLWLTYKEVPELFVRTRLEWTSSEGKHTSFAAYYLTEEVVRTHMAAAYDNPPPTPQLSFDVDDPTAFEDMSKEQLQAVLDEGMDLMIEQAKRDAPYHASWRQTVPTSGDPEIGEAMIGQYGNSHGASVMAAKNVEPDMLCMLSDSDMGSVDVDELIRLANWVSAQPEVAGKS